MSSYPETVSEVLEPNMRFNRAALAAVRAFAASGPWTGSIDKRKEKFRKLNHDLAAAYGIPEPELLFGRMNGGSSGKSHYIPSLHRIVIVSHPSVCSLLHEWRHAWQYVTWERCSERDACRWSINLFRRIWPEQFSKLDHVGHMLVRRGRSGGRALPANQFTGPPQPRQ